MIVAVVDVVWTGAGHGFRGACSTCGHASGREWKRRNALIAGAVHAIAEHGGWSIGATRYIGTPYAAPVFESTSPAVADRVFA